MGCGLLCEHVFPADCLTYQFMRTDWAQIFHHVDSLIPGRVIKRAVNWSESTMPFQEAKGKLISRAMLFFPLPDDLLRNERPMNISLIYGKCSFNKTGGVIGVST